MSEQQKRIESLVEKIASELGEHCDSVRIFITARSETNADNWIAYSEGRGNIYAQMGQVSDWLVRQDERTRIDENKSDKEGED